MNFSEEYIKTWEKLLKFKKNELKKDWVYRGQGDDYSLATTLER